MSYDKTTEVMTMTNYSDAHNVKSATRRRTSGMPIAHIMAWVYALLLIIPLYYVLTAAFKTNLQIFTSPFWPQFTVGFQNFIDAWSRASLGPGLLNSVVITLAAEVVTLALAIPASYALARSSGRVANLMEKFFALGFLIPGFAALVPSVLLAVGLGLFHTRTFLILFLPAGALPISIILLTQFMRTVPRDLEESAMIDGASRLSILLRVYLPLTIPGITTVVILNFLAFWNEYLFALILLGSGPEVRTAQVALPTLVSQTNTEYGILAAGTLITLIPVYIVYLVLQRRMEEALLSGAVKT